MPAQLDPHGEMHGGNLLAQRQTLAVTARALGLDPEEANRRLLGGLEKLRAARAHRPRPSRDEKIITAWNGLMISALARGHVVLGGGDQPVLLTAATRAAEFIERELHDEGRGILYRSWLEGRGATEGFAEDYACLIQGLLDLYEAGFETRWLCWADRLQRKMDELFRAEDGGYFNSAAGAGACRPLGVLIAVPVMMEWWVQRHGLPGGSPQARRAVASWLGVAVAPMS